MSELLSYRVRDGFTFGVGTDEETPAGGIVKLTKEQGTPFLDVLELVGAENEAPAPELPEEQPDEPAENWGQDLIDYTIAELKQLPQWGLIPEPRPTRKADIIEALELVM